MGIDCCSEEVKDEHEFKQEKTTEKRLLITVDSQENISTAHITPTNSDFKKREKKSVQTFFDGATYEGEWMNGLKDGKGKEV